MRIKKYRQPVICAALLGALTMLPAQEPKWSFTVGGGWTLLPMSSVNSKHRAEIEGWAEQGVPLKDFPELGQAAMTAIRVQYRFSHNGAVTVAYSGFSQEVSSSSLDPGIIFSTSRAISMDDFAVGILQYFPEIIYPVEMYFELAVGRANVKFRGDKIGEVTLYSVPTVFDEVARFSTAQGYAAVALGANLPLFGPLVLNGEVRFKSIQVGPMDGKLVQAGIERAERTLTSFDFSGLYISLGLGLEF